MKRVFKICRQIIKIELTMNKLDPWLEHWLELENKKGVGYYEVDIEEMNNNVRTLKETDAWDDKRPYNPVAGLGYEVDTWDFNDPEVRAQIEKDTQESHDSENEVGIEKLSKSFDNNPKGPLPTEQGTGDVIKETNTPPKTETPEEVNKEINKENVELLQEKLGEGTKSKVTPGVDEKAIEEAPTKEAALLEANRQKLEAFTQQLETLVSESGMSAMFNIPSDILTNYMMDSFQAFVAANTESYKRWIQE